MKAQWSLGHSKVQNQGCLNLGLHYHIISSLLPWSLTHQKCTSRQDQEHAVTHTYIRDSLCFYICLIHPHWG